jgi:hypothetical protein
MKYWHNASSARPCVSKMGSDFCSVPGNVSSILYVF